MLNAAPLRFDAAGRITTLDVANFPSPHFNGGTPMGDLGSLVYAVVPPADDVRVGGLRYTNAGALQVNTGGVKVADVQGGLPVDANGRLLVSLDQPVSYHLAGIPFDAAGRVALATPTPPIALDAFDSAFSGAFG